MMALIKLRKSWSRAGAMVLRGSGKRAPKATPATRAIKIQVVSDGFLRFTGLPI